MNIRGPLAEQMHYTYRFALPVRDGTELPVLAAHKQGAGPGRHLIATPYCSSWSF